MQIANLGQRLNAALASKVEELQRYRSEFFGRLREVLPNRPGIQVVGDRFVFQSEVLFPVGSADMTPAGAGPDPQLAATLKQIAAEIPPDLNWILRVDGHADRSRVTQRRVRLQLGAVGRSGRSTWSSCWSTRACRRTGWPRRVREYQPLDPADTPEAYAQNRRIELRLTDR